jgi:hypothetical protein
MEATLEVNLDLVSVWLTTSAVTREDMQTLKNDWLTDNVGLIARDSPLLGHLS